MLDWDEQILEYKTFLLLEKGLSVNTIEAYLRDINLFRGFISEHYALTPSDVRYEQIENFLAHLHDLGSSATTHARVISGVKSFFNYLYLYDKIETLPTELVDTPKIKRKIPDVLTVEEVLKIVDTIELNTALDYRNKAILDVMYSCGLRVSEVCGLKISDLFFNDGFIRVIGKGDKQRLVPVNEKMIKSVNDFIEIRNESIISYKNEDILFLNRRGKQLSRVMVFNIVKNAVEMAGVRKNVSPHTFRHSFATHLLKGGVDIRFVQEMLGHESITTTEIYTHLDIEHKRSIIEKFHPLSKMDKE
ncbi:MAG: site-specific tyrosine recombinase XerD [Rikenellaceae bacterium]